MMELRVTTEDGFQYVGTPASRDLLQWELRDHKRSASQLEKVGVKVMDLYEMAWHMLRRLGVVEKTLDLKDFQANYDIEPVESAEQDEEARVAYRLARRYGLIDPISTFEQFVIECPPIPDDQLPEPVSDPKPSSPGA